MGIALDQFPAHIRAQIDPQMPQALLPGVTPEARRKAIAKDEREIQKQIAGYLRLIGAYYVQSRTDRKTTNQTGTPDFIVLWKGQVHFWEVKCPWSPKLRPEQTQARMSIEGNLGQWRLITGLADAQAALKSVDADGFGSAQGRSPSASPEAQSDESKYGQSLPDTQGCAKG
jgi:hypothetical protein